MKRVEFTVPGPPQPKQRARKGRGGRWYTPTATVEFQKNVAIAAVCSPVPRFDGPVKLTVEAFMPDKRRRDADNVAKAVSDALNGVAWEDDDQVVLLVVRKQLDRDNPRTVVIIESFEPTGAE